MSDQCQACRGKRQAPFEKPKWVASQARWLCENCRHTLRLT